MAWMRMENGPRSEHVSVSSWVCGMVAMELMSLLDGADDGGGGLGLILELDGMGSYAEMSMAG